MEGISQTLRHRLTVGITYGLLAAMVVGLPLPAGAQFITQQQAIEQEKTALDSAMTSVLTEINAKGASAKSQITALFDDVESGKIGASNAERKASTVTEKLKSQLTTILTDYTKKKPDGTSLRAAYDAAQQVINDTRRLTEEGLDQAYLQKQENPNQLTGKYLVYQNKIKDITAKGIKKADDRLAERGSKDSVKKDLQSIIDDTQQQVEIATTSFLSVNTTVLASAAQRIKKDVLDSFGNDMVSRFKKAEERGNDKALDLTEEEQAQISASLKEASDAVDRAIQTTEQLTQQIASSNLPTTSNVPGVNPLLEAKFKAQKQVGQIRDSTLSRLDAVNKRYQARTDVSALAKEVMAREITNEKNRLQDIITEYLDYFSSGDPTKKKYNQAKRDAQEEAEGCGSVLCDIGRAVSGVARGVIQKTTGVDIGSAGQGIISNGIFQIDDPNPYARSKYQTGAVRYTTLPGGVSASGTLQYNPGQCLVQAEPAKKSFAFVEKAQAADPGANFDWNSLNPFGSSGGRSYVPSTSPLYGEGGVDPNKLFPNGNTPVNNTTKTTSSPKPSIKDYVQFGLTLFNSNSQQRAAQQVQGQFACNSQPNLAYGSPFTGTPVGGLLGYGNNNIVPGFNSNNWFSLMQSMATIGAQTRPCLNQVLPYFNDGKIMGSEYNSMVGFMGQGCMPPMPSPNPYYTSSLITMLMRTFCSPDQLIANPQLVVKCREAWVRASQTGQVLSANPINPTGSVGSVTPIIPFPNGTSVQVPELKPAFPSAQDAQKIVPVIPASGGTAKPGDTTTASAQVAELKKQLDAYMTQVATYADAGNFASACSAIKSGRTVIAQMNDLKANVGSEYVSMINRAYSAYCEYSVT